MRHVKIDTLLHGFTHIPWMPYRGSVRIFRYAPVTTVRAQDKTNVVFRIYSFGVSVSYSLFGVVAYFRPWV